MYRAQIGGTVLGTAGQFAGATDEIAANVNKEMQGLELALAWGPIKLQGEVTTASFDATHQAAGQTVPGTWNDYLELIGTSPAKNGRDAYRGGIFLRIRPNNNFSAAAGLGRGRGARLANYDASDISVRNNSREQNVDKGETLTFAVNWLLNSNVKFMLNYSDTKFKPSDTSPAQMVTPLDVTGSTPTAQDSEKIISFRGVVNF